MIVTTFLKSEHFESSNATCSCRLTIIVGLYLCNYLNILCYYLQMSRKWNSDNNLPSHKLNSFETTLEIIIVLQAVNLKMYGVCCFSSLVFPVEENNKTCMRWHKNLKICSLKHFEIIYYSIGLIFYVPIL